MKQSKFTNENLTTKQRLIKDFFIGSVSQIAALLCCTPLQRYQMLLIQQENIKYKQHPKSLLRIWLDTVEGINNLWRSHPDDLKYICSTGLLFTINGFYKGLLVDQSVFLAGALAGATHLFLIYPLILTKLKLQEPQYKKILLYENNFMAQLIKIGKIQGFTSLYKGYCLSAISASLYRSIYFGGYDYFQKYLKVYPYFDNFITKLMLSYVITIFAEIVSYPFEKSVKNKSRQVNKYYFSQLAEVVGRYRTIKASLVIVFYGEFFKLYERLMYSFILDRNDQLQL